MEHLVVKGQGILMTQSGDFASWIRQTVGNVAQERNVVVHGVTWSIPPATTGELAFMDGVIRLFEMEIDRQGNLLVREWE